MLKIDLHPEADAELEAAYRWYLRRRPGYWKNRLP